MRCAKNLATTSRIMSQQRNLYSQLAFYMCVIFSHIKVYLFIYGLSYRKFAALCYYWNAFIRYLPYNKTSL